MLLSEKFGVNYRIIYTDGIDYWACELINTNDIYAGVKIVSVVKYILTNENTNEETNEKIIKYMVEIEEYNELVKWNKGIEEVLNVIVLNPTYEIVDSEIVTWFDDELEALNYANVNYPKINLEELITSRFR